VGPYEVVESRSSVAEFHARDLPAEPIVWQHAVTERAVVLGSSQPATDVDRHVADESGVVIVRRRSGGGAVLLVPGEVTWVDVVVPRGAKGWSDDVHGPMRWLGGHLAAMFGELLPGRSVAVHGGPMVTTPWSRRVCFDGVGVGEVLLDGAKLVGISQRRTRDAARLQCCWYHRHDPGDLTVLLRDPPPAADLRPVATVPHAIGAALVADLVHALNR
jgi:lipoate-protein ligase A